MGCYARVSLSWHLLSSANGLNTVVPPTTPGIQWIRSSTLGDQLSQKSHSSQSDLDKIKTLTGVAIGLSSSGPSSAKFLSVAQSSGSDFQLRSGQTPVAGLHCPVLHTSLPQSPVMCPGKCCISSPFDTGKFGY